MDMTLYAASLTVMLLCAAAAVEDMRTLTISNWISVIILVLGFSRIAADFSAGETIAFPGLELFLEASVIAVPAQAWQLAAADIALFICVMFLMELLFRVGALGGGDCKLILALTVWFGVNGFAEFLIAMSMMGGILAAFVIAARLFRDEIFSICGVFMPGGIHKSLYAEKKPPIPYAVAIAPGAIAVELAGATTDWFSLL